MNSPPILSAVRAMALIADSALWKLLRRIGSEEHILDVLPGMWETTLAFFEAAAANPRSLIDGSLKLELGGSEPKVTPRSLRAAVDLDRIRAASKGDTLIENMLSKAFSAMAAGVRNHASDFLPGGLFARDQHTAEMRERLSGMPMTSTGAERVFALGRFHDARAGFTRPENRDGVILGGLDDTVGWLREQANPERLWGAARKAGRQGLATTQAASHRDEGLAEREGRRARLEEKRAKRAAKTEAKEKLERLVLATRYSELVAMGVAD